jgi:hypothetical protein
VREIRAKAAESRAALGRQLLVIHRDLDILDENAARETV